MSWERQILSENTRLKHQNQLLSSRHYQNTVKLYQMSNEAESLRQNNEQVKQMMLEMTKEMERMFSSQIMAYKIKKMQSITETRDDNEIVRLKMELRD